MTEPQHGLTPEEIKLCHKAGELWDAFLALGQFHPSDVAELTFHIHAIQNMIMARAAQRDHPALFPRPT